MSERRRVYGRRNPDNRLLGHVGRKMEATPAEPRENGSCLALVPTNALDAATAVAGLLSRLDIFLACFLPLS